MLRTAIGSQPFRFFAFFSSAFALVACTSSDGASSGGACAPYTTSIDLKTPVVSFKSDVMPIIDQSCAFGSCHGGANSGNLTMPKGDATTTRTNLVGVAAPQLPSMKLVEPGAPDKSYLMKKIDGDICTLKDQCIGECSDTMPQSNDLLPVPERDAIRRWIAQGAADN
jgi:hypothetical protein